MRDLGLLLPTLLILGASVYHLVLGVRFRSGRYRGRVAQAYFNPDLPFFLRHLAVGAIPLSMIGFLMVFIVALTPATWLWVEIVSVLLSLLGIPTLMIVTLFVMVRPPGFLKPDWVQERERLETANPRRRNVSRS